MSLIRLIFPAVYLWQQGLCADDHDGNPKEFLKQRRLRDPTLHPDHRIIEHEPELLDEGGLTPLLQLGDLKLRHVITINRDKPWLLGHAQFSEEYHERRRLRESEDAAASTDYQGVRFGSRRLSQIQSGLLEVVAATPFIFATPRDRVRLMTVLNGAALPEAAYVNASLNYWTAPKIYEEPAKVAFTINASLIKNATLTGNLGGWTAETMGGNFSGSEEIIGNAYRDGQALRGARTEILTKAKAATPGWGTGENKKDVFMGMRLEKCSELTQEDPRCWLDAGVALSVYEEAKNKVIVFHSDWSVNWYEYIVWQNRAWIIDEMENQIKNQWTIDARQAVTPDMQKRKGDTFDENQERCAFKDVDYKGIQDDAAFAKKAGVSEAEMAVGYWSVVKKMVRVVLPEARDRVAERQKTVYLTGSGFGGAWVALASMWLKKVDDAAYQTFSIAGGGFQCLARQLDTDVNPWDEHKQINIYAHVMDVYARTDRVSGYQCLYGLWNMTEGNVVHTLCSGIVGFSGPQLIYRGESLGNYQEKAAFTRVVEARRLFDACQYYAHSPWYAAMLFVNDNVLMADGTTDGGCRTVEGIEQTDSLGKCPTASRVEADCEAIASTTQEFPLMACIYVAGGLAAFIVCMGLCGYTLLQRVRNDMWVFGHDKRTAQKQKRGFYFQLLEAMGIHMGGKKDKKKGDRAKQARERAKQARLNKLQKKEKSKKGKDKGDKSAAGEEEWQALRARLDNGADTIGNATNANILEAAQVLGPGQTPAREGKLPDEDEDEIAAVAAPVAVVDEVAMLDTFKKPKKEKAKSSEGADGAKKDKSKDPEKSRDRRRDKDGGEDKDPEKSRDRRRDKDGGEDKDKDRSGRSRGREKKKEDGEPGTAEDGEKKSRRKPRTEGEPSSSSRRNKSEEPRKADSAKRESDPAGPKESAGTSSRKKERRRSKSAGDQPLGLTQSAPDPKVEL